MKHSRLVVFVGTACLPHLALAGGLLLPGSGAISTARAGAGVASADDGEAISLNPAGIAKSSGNMITLSAAMLSYAMEFQRRGTYDPVAGESYDYAGQPFAAEQNEANPPLGFGSIVIVPVISFVTDLGDLVPGLHLGLGLYAPNSYPFRDMCTKQPAGCQKYVFNNDATQPPPARYDIMKQEAAVILPSLDVAYRIVPSLDLGLRLSAGHAQFKSTTALWGTATPNYEEDIKKDAVFSVDATDSFVPGFGVGVAFRPTPNIELGANYSSELDIHARGDARSQLGPSAGLPGFQTAIVPVPDDSARCQAGGTEASLKACVDLALPQNAQIAGRYKFLDAAGKLRGDVELDLGWENWGKSCSADDLDSGSCTSPGDYRVVVDAQAMIGAVPGGLPLNTSIVPHGLKNSYTARLGGSFHVPLGPPREHEDGSEIIVRGGVGYDTAMAKAGWFRADLDGAAHTTLAAGASLRTGRFEIDVGGGAILTGKQSNPNVGGGAEPCNPTATMQGCGTAERQGPDPINPLLPANTQAESPVSQGDYKSHYLMFTLGVSTWF
ncbi:MAG TPA: outer membrane protein transport protein [Kofleriaceae bacterium]|nr:outer membrane protein transport protein [Kofleriaceae bacterium]